MRVEIIFFLLFYAPIVKGIKNAGGSCYSRYS